MKRSVKLISFAKEVDMGGFPVRQPLPSALINDLDPFLLLHHAKVKYPGGRKVSELGVGPHPHRGFSPVSFIYKGGVHHRDSRGNDGVIYEGGVQWMNSGMGIIHSERPPVELAEKGGVGEFIQLWVNSPNASKMKEPEYFPLSLDETPQKYSEDKKVHISVSVGEFEDLKGPIHSETDVKAIRIDFQKGGEYTFDIAENYNVFAYLLNGEINLEGHGLVEKKNLIVFNNDGTSITIKATQDAHVLLMAGVPLNEPVETYGPFVMSSTTEVMEAIRDYQMGKMGVLIENF